MTSRGERVLGRDIAPTQPGLLEHRHKRLRPMMQPRTGIVKPQAGQARLSLSAVPQVGIGTASAPRANAPGSRPMLASAGHIAYYRLYLVSIWDHDDNVQQTTRRGHDADGFPAYSHAIRRTTGCSVSCRGLYREIRRIVGLGALLIMIGTFHPGWVLPEPHYRSGHSR